MENDDLLGGDPVEPVEPVEPVAPDTPVEPTAPDPDASPAIDTTGVKSVAEAIDFGLSEVEARREGKKPAADETPEAKAEREAAEALANETPEQKTAREAAEAAAKTGTPEDEATKKAKAEKDAVEAPIPPGAAPKTAERMKTLIDLVKDKDSQIAQHQAFVDQIAATGANPQEFGAMMSYMTAVHSDNPEHLRLAQKLLLSELEGISLKLGEAAPGIDFLAKYPDLQQQVERGEIRREAAQELALTRTRAAAEKAQKDDATARNNETAAATKERNDAQAELTTLGNELFAKHGAEYTRRYAILEPALEALGMLPPKQWKAAFLRAYNAIPAAAPVAPSAKPTLPAGGTPPAAKPAAGQPLRANKTPSGESKAGPKSLFEAIDAAITQGS